MNLKKISRGFLVVLCIVSLGVIAGSYVQGRARAQVLAQGSTVAANEYFCDPAIVSPCPVKDRQIIYISPQGEMYTRFQDSSVPGNPEHIVIRGHGMMANVYPEISSYWALTTTRYSPAGIATHSHLIKAGSSTCDNGGTLLEQSTMLGYTVYEYEKVTSGATQLLWMAPDLHCRPLRREMHWTEIKEPSIQIADSVTIGTQPDSIWNLPTNMKEESPQDLFHALFVSRAIRFGHAANEAELSWSTSSASTDATLAQAQKAWLAQHPQ